MSFLDNRESALRYGTEIAFASLIDCESISRRAWYLKLHQSRVVRNVAADLEHLVSRAVGCLCDKCVKYVVRGEIRVVKHEMVPNGQPIEGSSDGNGVIYSL